MLMCHTFYRAYCGSCREIVRWIEPSGKTVHQIQCPQCGRMLEASSASQYNLKGELIAQARTFVEKHKGR